MYQSLLIIGGSYFAGRVLVEEMLRTGDYDLYVLNRGTRPLNLDGVVELRADRHDPKALERVIPDEKWAGVIDFCGHGPQDVETILSALSHRSIDHYIFISTSGVYQENLALPLVETSPLLGNPPATTESVATDNFDKCQAEKSVKQICRTADIAWTILRPAMIYGRYNYTPRERYFFELLQKDKPLPVPQNNLALFQFVLVDDLARVIRYCLKDEFSRDTIFNVAAPEMISYARFVEVLEEITGRSVPVRSISLQEVGDPNLRLPFPLDRHHIISSERLIRALSFEYTGFAEGLRQTWQWFNDRP